jgi:hypothetical protein
VARVAMRKARGIREKIAEPETVSILV